MPERCAETFRTSAFSTLNHTSPVRYQLVALAVDAADLAGIELHVIFIARNRRSEPAFFNAPRTGDVLHRVPADR